MYIKIKDIKKYLLIFSCLFFAGFNYLNLVEADERSANDPIATICNKNIDFDCDGLTNTEEKAYGTDQNNPDSDGDGYSDGVEVRSGYDPLKPAPGDKLVATAKSDDGQSSASGETSDATLAFSKSMADFVSSKNGQPISSSDIQNFVNEQISSQSSVQLTFETLPAIDRSSIKILPQTYPNLSAQDRKTAQFKDAVKFASSVIYLLSSNAPEPILNGKDFENFRDNFLEQFQTIGTQNVNLAYFQDLGYRLRIVREQLVNMEVPETMVDLYVKLIQLIDACLSINGTAFNNSEDSMARISEFSKISQIANLLLTYMGTDVTNYLNQFKD